MPDALRMGGFRRQTGGRTGVLANAGGGFRLRHPIWDAVSVMQAKA
jgi:hypothetical protein